MLKWRCHRCGTNKQTNNNNYSAFDLENGVLQLLRIEHGVISYPMVLATVGID